MILTDTHTHMYSRKFTDDRDAAIQRCLDAGVTRLFLPNIDSTSIDSLMDLANTWPDNCFPMMGLHPTSVGDNVDDELEIVRQWLFEKLDNTPHGKFFAVGEIGLDYYWDTSFKDQQQMAFRKQIGWAKELGLPIVVHCRDAMDDILDILEELNDDTLNGILHCFTGTLEQAQRALAIGFYLGIGGVVTFKNGGVAEVVQQLSIENIVLETDSPYLAPTPNRGKRNESSYLTLVADKVAECLRMTVEQVAVATTDNSQKIFSK